MNEGDESEPTITRRSTLKKLALGAAASLVGATSILTAISHATNPNKGAKPSETPIPPTPTPDTRSDYKRAEEDAAKEAGLPRGPQTIPAAEFDKQKASGKATAEAIQRNAPNALIPDIPPNTLTPTPTPPVEASPTPTAMVVPPKPVK